jgi:hypothetical protein
MVGLSGMSAKVIETERIDKSKTPIIGTDTGNFDHCFEQNT